MTKAAKLLAILVTAAAYIIVGFVLYHQRVSSSSVLWQSDLLVFYLPFAAALLVFLLIMWPRKHMTNSSGPYLAAVLIALLATCMSAFIYTYCAFNRYGT